MHSKMQNQVMQNLLWQWQDFLDCDTVSKYSKCIFSMVILYNRSIFIPFVFAQNVFNRPNVYCYFIEMIKNIHFLCNKKNFFYFTFLILKVWKLDDMNGKIIGAKIWMSSQELNTGIILISGKQTNLSVRNQAKLTCNEQGSNSKYVSNPSLLYG